MTRKTIYELYDYLPQTNCGECGMTCMGFAGYLLSRDVKPGACPPLDAPEFAEKKQNLIELLGTGEKNELTGLIVDDSKCIGCGICVNVCPVHGANNPEVSLGKGPRHDDTVVMQIIDARIRLICPEKCNRAIPTAPPCKACADYCPLDAIELV
jgi:4Fe-4S ferredoxin